MMKTLSRTVLAVLIFAPFCAGAAQAAPSSVVEALQKTPVSVFTYGYSNLYSDFQSTFAGEKSARYALFAAPLAGKMGEIANLIYKEDTGTITLNLVNLTKLPEGSTPDDACGQAMMAMRTFAGLDMVTGQLQPDSASSAMAGYFAPAGTPLPDAANKPVDIDKIFKLRFNGLAAQGRFTCVADLFGTDYTIEK